MIPFSSNSFENPVAVVINSYLTPIASRAHAGNGDDRAVAWVIAGLKEEFARIGDPRSVDEKINSLFKIDLLEFDTSGLYGVGPERSRDWRRAIDNLFNPTEVADDLLSLRNAFGTAEWDKERDRFNFFSDSGREEVERLSKAWSARPVDYLIAQVRWIQSIESRLRAARKRPPLVEWVLRQIDCYRGEWTALRSLFAEAAFAPTQEPINISLFNKKEWMFRDSYWFQRRCQVYCGRAYGCDKFL